MAVMLLIPHLSLLFYFALALTWHSMIYHGVLIGILEPLTAVESSNLRTSPNDHATVMGNTPQEIVTNSTACLETILRLYYLRHGFGTYDLVLCQFLMLVGFNSLKDFSWADQATRESKLSTVILCGKGFLDQSRNFYLAEVVFYMLRDAMDSESARALKEFTEIEEDEERRERMARHVRSDWPINIVNVTENPEDHRLSNLVRATESLTMEETDSASSRCSPKPA
jgi:hypothetical protein